MVKFPLWKSLAEFKESNEAKEHSRAGCFCTCWMGKDSNKVVSEACEHLPEIFSAGYKV